VSARSLIRSRSAAWLLAFVLLSSLTRSATVVHAQGDLDAPTPTGRDPIPTNRLDILAASLTLTKEQKSAVKAQLDAAHKSAAPVRAQLLATRAAIAAAVQAGKPQADIDAAVAAHAAELTAMAQLEMKALAEVLAMLTPDQQNAARTNGIRTPFFLFRGIFLDNGRWNSEPDPSGY
jgi:Spy/CpxP family protein refolding chaperone